MIFRLTGMVADARCGPATLHDKTCQVHHDDVVSAPSSPGPQDHARRVLVWWNLGAFALSLLFVFWSRSLARGHGDGQHTACNTTLI